MFQNLGCKFEVWGFGSKVSCLGLRSRLPKTDTLKTSGSFILGTQKRIMILKTFHVGMLRGKLNKRTSWR